MPNTKTIKLMTYNLKFACPDYEPSWEVRRDMQVALIRKHSPDIIGTQEGLKDQIDYLAAHLPEYVVVGEGRKGGDADEHMAIFFRRDRFRLREMHSFGLSETPDIIGSGPEFNPRMVTWLRLAYIDIPASDENGPYPTDYRGYWEHSQELYVFNTHLNVGRRYHLARVNSAKLISERICALDRFGEWTPARPVFLLGDFNALPGGDVYKTLVGDTNTNEPGALTDCVPSGDRQIDWILSRGNVKVLSYDVIDYNVDGVYPSDHKPIQVEYAILDK